MIFREIALPETSQKSESINPLELQKRLGLIPNENQPTRFVYNYLY